MTYATREALLGASDLREEDVELASIGMTVKVRSLPAAYSNQAMSEALEMQTGRRGEQTARVNTAKLEALQVLHALVEPKLKSIEEAYTLAQHTGPAWRSIVDKIDEISGIDKATIEKTQATFPAGGSEAAGSDVGNGAAGGSGSSRPDLPVPSGS